MNKHLYWIDFAKVIGLGLLKSQMFAIALGVGYATESLTPVCTPMWFFYALFIIKIVYAVVPKTKISKTFQFVLCLVAVRLLTIYNIDTYIPLDSAIMAYPFFLIGTESKQLLNSSCCRNYKKVSLTVIVLVLSYFISQFNGRCDIDTMRYGSYYSLFIFTGIATTISILTICKMIIEYVSYIKSQLTVLCIGAPLIVGLNLLIINVVKPIFSFLVGEWNSIYGMILGIIIMCLFYPLIISQHGDRVALGGSIVGGGFRQEAHFYLPDIRIATSGGEATVIDLHEEVIHHVPR